MKIVVCIKQVPESNNVKFDPVTHNLMRGGMSGRINPFDKNAIEAALRLRDAVGGEVALLSMGPDSTAEILRDGLAMGADSAYLLSSRAFAGADTLSTGYVLAQAVRQIGNVDLTLLGRQAVDADTGQVGPIMAVNLNQPQATYATQLTANGNQLTVVRDLDSLTQTVELTLPAVVTVRAEANTPRYETPLHIQQSFEKQVTIWRDTDLALDPAKLGQTGSPTVVRKVYAPEAKTRAQQPLASEPAAAVDQLLVIMQQHGLI
ncbi:electron transfer flavoprotein subunit beta/FixA family protein [Lacticaseibacillus suilingensis]|uniref:Electron transfer flavoprotein small subunit n=1 Tax=Lacticaseibacillus suilingensis TaxID=2799577 RepID=A0ABW4BGF2_9LACO|nr:electron transfer flavoprotein subunit beta/FixA family protein [Lacticaseibacillus suilingensis]